MVNVKLNWDMLLSNLRSRLSRLESFNLIMVAMPINSAHVDAQKLAGELNATYIDFDEMLIAKLEEDGWDEHISLAKHGHIEPGRKVAQQLIHEIMETPTTNSSIVIGNPNLAAYYKLDLGVMLYDRTKEVHCILAAPGRVSGGTLLLHGIHPQTGSGFMPIWELVND